MVFLVPRVSVVIPTYNNALTICRAIDGVFRQTFQDFEVIVVDDGSADDTTDILRSYADRIIYIYQENLGRSAARNRGIESASGEYIAFLDADDWWSHNKLEKDVAMLDAFPNVGLVHCLYRVVDAKGTISRIVSSNGNPNQKCFKFEDLVFRNVVGSPSFVTVRKSVVDREGGFHTALHGTEDWDLWLRIAVESDLALVSEPLAMYQLHDTSALERILARNVQTDWLRIMERIFADGRVQSRYGHLEKPAKARVHLRNSLLFALNGDWARSKNSMKIAIALDSGLLTPPFHEMSDWIIEYGSIGVSSRSAAADVLSFVDLVWDTVPDATSNLKDKGRHQTRARQYASRFFTAHEAGNPAEVRRIAFDVLRFNPRLMANLGFWSILVRSLIVVGCSTRNNGPSTGMA